MGTNATKKEQVVENKTGKERVSFLNMLAFQPGSTEFSNRLLITAMKSMVSQKEDANGSLVEYEMWDRELTYLKNFYIMETENLNFKKAFAWVIQTLYFNSMCAIVKVGNNFAVYSVSDYKENICHEILTATLQISINDDKSYLKYKKGDPNIVIVRANAFNKPWWFFSERYYKEYIEAYAVLKVNRINSQHTKMFIDPITTPGKQQEVKMTTIPGTNFLLANREYEIVDLAVKNETAMAWEDIHNVEAMWCKYRGIRFNLSRKDSERNLTDELENDSILFDFVEQDKLKVFNYMLDEITEKGWGVEATVKTLIEIEEEKSMEKMMQGQDKGDEKDD